MRQLLRRLGATHNRAPRHLIAPTPPCSQSRKDFVFVFGVSLGVSAAALKNILLLSLTEFTATLKAVPLGNVAMKGNRQDP